MAVLMTALCLRSRKLRIDSGIVRSWAAGRRGAQHERLRGAGRHGAQCSGTANCAAKPDHLHQQHQRQAEQGAVEKVRLRCERRAPRPNTPPPCASSRRSLLHPRVCHYEPLHPCVATPGLPPGQVRRAWCNCRQKCGPSRAQTDGHRCGMHGAASCTSCARSSAVYWMWSP